MVVQKSLAILCVSLAFTSHVWLPKVCHSLMPLGVTLMEDVRIPENVLDFFLRPALKLGFFALVSDLEEAYSNDMDAAHKYIANLKTQPIALFTPDANEQHYEVETRFFDVALGKRKKYSSGLYDLATVNPADSGGAVLEEAEEKMLDLYVQRAEIQDGQTILDLGCGWGSVSLYLAERFPKSRIIGVSNSRTQRKYIMDTAKSRGLSNVEIETLNVAGSSFDDFVAKVAGKLDRIVSIEMFEHMKNYELLLEKLSVALKPGGKLFVHIFCHKFLPYDFTEDDLNAWMTKHFFKGGTMPSQFFLTYFQKDLKLDKQWNVNGKHYALTLDGWLQNMDKKRQELLEVFKTSEDVDGSAAKLQLRRWRIFMIACAEFFGFRGGTEFYVTHHLFSKPS